MNDWYYLKSLDFKRRMLIARHLTGAIARRLSGFAVEGLSGFIFSTGGGPGEGECTASAGSGGGKLGR